MRNRNAERSPAEQAGGPAGARRWTVLAAAVAASWVLPLVLNAVSLDVVLIPVLLLAVASLLRVGGGLLDRLVVAAFVLCGSVMAFGLLFSLWPWGLAPVPTAGFLLTVASVTGWLSGRRPHIPLKLRGSDVLVLGTAAVVWKYVHHPLAGKSAADRIAYFATAEDRMGHFSYFDGIHHIGGYAFLHQEAARTYMMTPAEAVYPQGTHFLLAWIDILVKSSTDGGDALGMMNRYLLYVMAAYALFCAALVWAARWVGGPRLRGWRTAAVCATVLSIMLSGSMANLVEKGFDSETVGLLFLTVALALLLRPAMGRAEFALVGVVALVAVTFVYNLYGVLVGIALAAVLVIHRRRFAARRGLLFGALAAGALVAGLPTVFSVLTKLDVAKTSNLAGPMVIPDRPVLIGCTLLVLVAAALPVNRRTATGRTVFALVLGTGLVLAVFGFWQLHTIGYLSYYFEKLAAGGLVIALISLGMVGLMLQPAERTKGTPLRRRAERLGLSAVATAAALSMFAGVQWGVPSGWSKPSAWYDSPMVKWAKGEAVSDMGPATNLLTKRDLKGVTTPVIALYSNDSYHNLKSTFIAQLLTHQGGNMVGLYEVFYVKIGGPAVPPKDKEKPADKDKTEAEKAADREKEYQSSLGHLKKAIADCPAPPTILVGDAKVAERLKRDLASADVRATVVHAPFPNS
ncbi:hypothetical protein OG689_24335 [Kitasatospora sp. NBC_00240]|uniref:hypothetical protein n=1 Tax=Kitasatospora sp. NBC_00240 TaxID=2903567 RepID=UPI002258B3B7|nr:hypothetical protein [Kitasatospora sp. NBC_00240]MCX5212372.1 hypothetical protein [Kitasatospora sp. NBC_00240]